MAEHRRWRRRHDDDVDWDGARRAVMRDLLGSDGFLVVFALILLAVFLVQAAEDLALGPALATIATIGAVVLAMVRAKAPRSWYRIAAGIGAIAAVVAVVNLVTNDGQDDAFTLAGSVLFSAFLLLTLPAVIGAAFGHERITLNTVAATLTALLLLGLLFASLYRTVALIETEPFFASGADDDLANMTYFSFVTITTLGYGDLSPATGVGHGMATIEAVLGQVYLVTAVALTVSRLGRDRLPTEELRRAVLDDPGAPAPPDGPVPPEGAQGDSDDSDDGSPPT